MASMTADSTVERRAHSKVDSRVQMMVLQTVIGWGLMKVMLLAALKEPMLDFQLKGWL